MKRFARLFLILFASVAIFFAQGVSAQGDRGSIAGHVADSSGAVLQGAQVELQPTGATAVTTTQGSYFINNLAPGAYTLTVSYVGFSLFTQTVNVTAGQTSALEVKLAVASQNDQVIVTAERASGEAEAVNRERTADNIVQVLPADVIRSLPNANMADALGRLPSVTIERDEGEGKYVQVRGTEPRLTNATIDGINIPSPESGVRQIKFDAIPADIVESVEINKTLQANMDGDGIGGSVNLVTKTATERPTIQLYGLGGISPINGGRNNYESTATVGKRFGAQHKLGALIGGSYDWNGRGIDDTEPTPDIATFPDGSTNRYFDAADIREYRYYRTRWAIAGSTDYQLSEGTNLYVRGLFSSFHNFGDRWVYSLRDNTTGITNLQGNGCSGTDPNGFTAPPCTGAPSFNNSIRRPRYVISSLVAGGKTVHATTWYSWDISVSRSTENDDGYGGGSFSVPSASTFPATCTYDAAATGNSLRPRWAPGCFTEAYNTSIYALNDLNISRGKTAQLNLQFAGAMAKRYHIGSHIATIEVGGKFRNAHKYDHTYTDDYAIPLVGGSGIDQNDFAPGASIIPFNNFLGTFNNNHYYDGTYPFGPTADYFKTQKFVLANPGLFTFTTGAAGNGNFYNFVEQVSAGYVMNTFDFNKFRLIAGVRVEGTNLDTTSWQNGCTDTGTDSMGNPNCPVIIQPGFNFKAGGDYVKVLPSASIRYAVTDNTNIRLTYSRGFSRANPSDIAQAVSVVNASGASPGSVSFGNPGLTPEVANNYDLLFEHYLNPFGALTAGVFYKALSDPIVQTSQTLFNFTPPIPGYNSGTYLVSKPINAGTAHLIGFEIAYLQRFSSLPGVFSGLGVSANYGYTASEASGIPGRSDHPTLLRQAPHTWNISPTYDRGRLSVRVGLSYNGANIYSYQFQDGIAGGLKGPLGDTYLYQHFQVDAQGSYRIGHGFTFLVYGLNLNNEVFGFYNGSSPYLIQREYYTPTLGLGMRWSPSSEK
jgi:TonB-dependent receptor